MTAVAALALVACGAAGVLGALRWLRVAQREHYLAGRTTRFALRWWRARPWAVAGPPIGLATGVATGWLPVLGLVTAGIVGAGPPGLAVRGRTGRLRWTRRLLTLAGVLTVLTALPAAIAGALGGLAPAAAGLAVAVVAGPLLLDIALFLLAPLEERLARRYVERANDRLTEIRPRIVGITGSYGKTSTKRYLAHLLEGSFAVVASPRSFNNRAGLARTVNELLLPGTEVFVAEMGAYGPGEIAALCQWLPPEVAVITAIGPVHLERFRSLERTLAAKSEIVAGARAVVLNVDDERLAHLAESLSAAGRHVLCCGTTEGAADVRASANERGWSVLVNREEVARLEAASAPAAMTNVTCAIGAALALGLPPGELAARLANLPAVENRLEVTRGASGALVIDDTFNANPAGAQLAIDRLRAEAVPGRRVVVTPGMVELGPLQFDLNAELGAEVAEVEGDLLVVGRTNRRALLAGFQGTNGSTLPRRQARCVEDRDAAVAWVRTSLKEGDVVLYENDLPDHFP